MRAIMMGLTLLAFMGGITDASDPVADEASAVSLTSAKAAIEARNVDFKTFFAAKDAEALADLYTEDGMLIPPDAPNAVGREAIAAYWVPVMAAIASATTTTEEVFPFGDIHIVERSTVVLFDAEGNQIGSVKAMLLWRREGDVWKMHRDIWNYGE